MTFEVLAMSPAQVADCLGVSEVTVHRLIKSGELESFTIGRSRRVPAVAVREFVSKRQSVTA